MTAGNERPPSTRVVSGPGSEILRTIVRPWLKNAVEYDRVSSYYGPRSLLVLLKEFAKVWKAHGVIRLVLGYHDSARIIASLQSGRPPTDAVRQAVVQAIQGDADELARLIRQETPELISILRSLMQERAVHVRLVTPRINLERFGKNGKWPTQSDAALFLSQFAIFWQGPRRATFARKQEGGYYRSVRQAIEKGERFVVVNGSFNESERAYSTNIEDAVVHRSWVEGESQVAIYFAERFEGLWVNSTADVESMAFDHQFSDALGKTLERANPKWFGWNEFSNFVQESPWYDSLAIQGVGLLPHQQRILSLALSRWPVRAILADEVGLGKTIEAGSIIRYLLAHRMAKRVLVLSPASLCHQWQRELRQRFGLSFWVFDSSTGTCKSGREARAVGSKPLNHCDLVIASWHWARMASEEGVQQRLGERFPDLVVVDEAHHARLHPDNDSGNRSTLLFDFLQSLGRRVPHMLLLTATPFQTSQWDYWSLLSLTGLPDWYTPNELSRFALWAEGSVPDNFALNVRMLREVRKIAEDYTLQEYPKKASLRSLPADSPSEKFEAVLDLVGNLTRQEYLSIHPTTLLTLRNTRTVLKNEGYQFPAAHIRSVPMVISESQQKWLDDFESYVREDLGRPETKTNGSQVLGRMKSGFRQRAVSSVRAARNSLQYRRNSLSVFVDSDDSSALEKPDGSDALEPDNDDVEETTTVRIATIEAVTRSAQRQAALTERILVDRLLTSLDASFSAEGHDIDPKMVAIKGIVQEHLQKGRRVLVFSRFTSTTEAVVETLGELPEALPLGRYDGAVVGVYSQKEGYLALELCERPTVESFLRSGEIRVLVCSDAASEGLDLQAASVVINVDVPWNPARVIQRFGRVDRLGQKATEVFLVNAYYPGTIEERMYAVLEQRRITGVSMLGELVEVLSARQRQFTQHLLDGNPLPRSTFEEMERARHEYARGQFAQITLHGTSQTPAKNLFEGFIKAIAKERDVSVDKLSLKEPGRPAVAVDPMDDNFVGWSDPYWARFESPVKRAGLEAEVAILETEDRVPLALTLVHKGKCYPVPTKRWPLLFDFMFHADPLDTKDWPSFKMEDIEMIHDTIQSEEGWIRPVPERLMTISEIRPPVPTFKAARLRKIGRRVRILTST